MEAAAEEERQMQKYYKDELKKSWENSIENKHVDRVPEFQPEKFGPSSFQRFSGEDPNRQDRIRQQKAQMKRWVQEQAAEKAFDRYQQTEEKMKVKL